MSKKYSGCDMKLKEDDVFKISHQFIAREGKRKQWLSFFLSDLLILRYLCFRQHVLCSSLSHYLFHEQHVLFENVISDECDCSPDASTYLLCVMSDLPGRIKIQLRSYKSFNNDFHQSL